jgi:WD40 repeat protein
LEGRRGGDKLNTMVPQVLQSLLSIFNGKTFVISWNGKHLYEYDATSWSYLRIAHSAHQITSVVCCPIKPGWFVVSDNQGQLNVVSNTAEDALTFKSHCRLSTVDPVRFSACAWSQDGKWIATGNDVGDIFLWNAGVPTSVSFAMLLPRNRHNANSKPTTSLVFVPDSTALIIVSGGHLSVWDIEKVEYVANSGLPDMAMNIALDGPRNRLAVAVNENIYIYELKLPEERCQTDGKSSIPSERAPHASASDGRRVSLFVNKAIMYYAIILIHYLILFLSLNYSIPLSFPCRVSSSRLTGLLIQRSSPPSLRPNSFDFASSLGCKQMAPSSPLEIVSGTI